MMEDHDDEVMRMRMRMKAGLKSVPLESALDMMEDHDDEVMRMSRI
jgi:hypothetical protein